MEFRSVAAISLRQGIQAMNYLSTIVILHGLLSGTAHQTPRPIAVESALVTLIDEADVPAQSSGILVNIAVKEGQIVGEGDLLAQLDDVDAQLELEQSDLELSIARQQAENELAIQQARKTAEIAAAELRRATDSAARFKKSVSQTELDQLERGQQRALLEVEQAEQDHAIAKVLADLKRNALDVARQGVARRKITSPIAGMVVRIEPHRGEWVELGTTVVRVIRLETLRVEGFVDARQVPATLDGAEVSFELDLADAKQQSFPGRLVFVQPEADPVNGQVRVWAEIENRELRLRSGLRGTLYIRPESKPSAE